MQKRLSDVYGQLRADAQNALDSERPEHMLHEGVPEQRALVGNM